ncbi:hypothetical protein BHE74_00002655 [Ensete ventricosum]|nr:hypothetical protein BHE74_00002655 [Ensete ventricosum]
MENSLRYDGDSKSLRIHAKEKIPLASKTLLQVCTPRFLLLSCASQKRRRNSWMHINETFACNFDIPVCNSVFLPLYAPCSMLHSFTLLLSASMGFGIQLDKDEQPSYSLRGKKAFPVTASGLVGINLKGRFHFNKEYKEVTKLDRYVDCRYLAVPPGNGCFRPLPREIDRQRSISSGLSRGREKEEEEEEEEERSQLREGERRRGRRRELGFLPASCDPSLADDFFSPHGENERGDLYFGNIYALFFLMQVPYFKIRENNWTLHADINGKWNVRFDS